MDKNISATICLNMIVKNESHIIENTLEKLCSKIAFNYWVICDTGSTDNTPQIITDFFSKKGIKGELFYDEWVNFAHNRTLALQRAYKKTDLLLVFDADDEIVGNIVIPKKVLFDEYHFKFGSEAGTSYTRVLLINNHKQFEFLSVLHEFISCKEGPTKSVVINGDYYVVSGRTGNRNLDPDKYLKDALILEKAHAEALAKKDELFHRYAFYCANSYKDCGRFIDAIKWYKITISQEKQWNQEKYVSCLYIYDCYSALNQPESGFFYLVKSFAYDSERVECLFPLLVYYCCENMHKVAYNYYLNVKDFFETKYLNSDMSVKLFSIIDKYAFYVPYYMILIADKVKDTKCIVKMYEIIFIKKQKMISEWHIKNLLYNLQFFLEHVPTTNRMFIKLANDYLNFLNKNNINLESFDFLKRDVYKKYGLEIEKYFITEVSNKVQKFSEDECKQSKNILIYTGFSDIEWNHSYMLNNALGGSEKAVAYISKCFPKEYTIYISGHVKNEVVEGNIHYIHLNQLSNLINNIPFHTVIVSRYVSFYEMFKECSYYKSYIWGHDVVLLPYGCEMQEPQILTKWNKYINGCICLTDWHRRLFIERYPTLKDKITLINNGLDIDSFKNINYNSKKPNKFIYTSRPDRGLNILLNLWPKILEQIPDATLSISTYGKFPSNPNDIVLKQIIDSYPDSIHYLGKLKVNDLYAEMSTSEFWLYPTHWNETSCITALEMLMSNVICIYYPIAGLINTMDKYGIPIMPGEEIKTIINLTDEQKCTIKQNGRLYAESCSWEKRFNIWHNTLFKKEYLTIDDTVQVQLQVQVQESTNSQLQESTNSQLQESTNSQLQVQESTNSQLQVQESTNSQVIEINKIVNSDNKTMLYTNHYIPEVMDDYLVGLKTHYNIESSADLDYILYSKPTKIIFTGLMPDDTFNIIKKTLPNCEICLLNLEPLNLVFRLKNLKENHSINNLKIYDYSLTNIKILNDNLITNVGLLPYITTEPEKEYLSKMNMTVEKIYDFGILTGCGAPNNLIHHLGPKRKKVVEYLLSLGFTVNIIKGWKTHRDLELSKCKIILNIHGQLFQNEHWFNSNIFEHLRCDRLLNAGFTVLSEESYHLDSNFINKYPNLKIINYMDFFKPKLYTDLSLSFTPNNTIKKNCCFIHSCNLENVGLGRLEYLIKRLENSKCIDILENVYIINIGIPINTNYGDKYIIVNYDSDPTLYEAPTINKIQEFSSNNDNFNILYIHTKGIRYSSNNQKENDWIDLMLYFLLDKHTECIEKLNECYDAVGCNYYKIQFFNWKVPPHFSGNFWWGTSNYLKTIDKLNESLRDRNVCEYWLFKKDPIYHSMYNSNIDHFHSSYPSNLYTNLPNLTVSNENNNIGFIMLRNVFSKEANKFWIESYNSIRRFYPKNSIVIIDVSDEINLIIDKELTNTVILKSRYEGKYDIIPYLYYLENKPFEQAVILKDTIFFTKLHNFDKENRFLFQFEHNWNDETTEIEMIKHINKPLLLSLYFDKTLWRGCFESMSVITHERLQLLHSKYDFYSIYNYIDTDKTNSQKRNCAFERIFGIVFNLENGGYKTTVSGDIHWIRFFENTFETYLINKPDDLYWLSPMNKLYTNH
jgi:hypothetical protein